MIYFCGITVQSKGSDDWRAFLMWADRTTMKAYDIRGYGSTPGIAADDAYRRFSISRDFYSTDERDWV